MMKKVLAVILALTITLSLGSFVFSNAAGEKENVLTYKGAQKVGLWLNKFDEDDKAIGTAAVAFNAAASFDALIFQNIWCGKSENSEDVDVKFELYPYDTDFATSDKKERIFSVVKHFDGDQAPVYQKDAQGKAVLDENGNKIAVQPYGVVVELGKDVAPGEYVLRVSQVSDKAEAAPYAVLPIVSENLSNLYLKYEGGKEFGFGLRFAKKASGDYFMRLGEMSEKLEIVQETIAERAADSKAISFMKNMLEFGILTPEIPEGKALVQYTFIGSPTWSNREGNSDVGYDVYRWTGDYESSVTNKIPLYSGEVLDHSDNSPLTLDLGLSCFAGDRYLIVVYCSNDGDCGYWSTDVTEFDNWEFFGDGENVEEYFPAFYVGWSDVDESMRPADPTPVPETPAPTPTPETPAATQAATQAPAPTEAPKSKGCGSMIGYGTIALLAGVMIIARKKD